MITSDEYSNRVIAHLQVARSEITKLLKRELEDGNIVLDELEGVLEELTEYVEDVAAAVAVDVGIMTPDEYRDSRRWLELDLVVPLPPKNEKLHTTDWAQTLDPPLLQPKHPRDMTRDEWIQHFGDSQRRRDAMTIDEMIEKLEEAREDMSGDTEIRVAYQESYPLRGTVTAVTLPDPGMCLCAGEEDHDDDDTCPANGPGRDSDVNILWLALGNAPYEESPYAPRWAWGF